MLQSKITTVCVLLKKELSACVHTQLVSSFLLDIWLISPQYNHYPRPTLQVFNNFIEQRIEQEQMGPRKEVVDLVNGLEQTKLGYICG